MSLCINKYENINKFFGDIIDKMKNDPINFCLENERDLALKNFNKMFDHLDKSNVDLFIEWYKKKGINDVERIHSLISEIRAGSYLAHKQFPIEYIKEGDKKTPDIKTKIEDRDAFVEVKRISDRRFEDGKLQDEFKKKNIQYDVEFHLQTVLYSASDVINEIKKNIPSKVTNFYETVSFKYGKFRIKQMEGTKPSFRLTISYCVPGTKEEKEGRDDSDISRQEIEGGIENDLSNSIEKFDAYCNSSDLCFVYLDDIDVFNYGHVDLREYLYGRDDPKIIVSEPGKGTKVIKEKVTVIQEALDAYELGWRKILKDLGFLPVKFNFSSKQGWYLYESNAKKLNGVFHSFGNDFTFPPTYCFLNPFVKKSRNIPKLEDILEYYHEQDIIKFN